jgi:hypothetical protein
MTRRDSIKLLGGAGLFAQNGLGQRKRIAVVTTVYRENSHADVIAGRLIAGYEYNGERRKPAVDVVSMYTDQHTWHPAQSTDNPSHFFAHAHERSRGVGSKKSNFHWQILPTLVE